MKKLTPKAVIFDLGSTLIEYETVPWDELQRECAENARQFLIRNGYDAADKDKFNQGFDAIRDDYRRVAAESLVEWNVVQVASRYLAETVGEHSPHVAEQFFDAYYQPVDSLLYAYDDTVSTLEHLKSRYETIGLISNTVFPERAHLSELKRFGVEPFLKFTVFSSTFGWRKPHRAIFEHAVSLAGEAPGECVYIGDRYVEDIQGPSSIGMSAILKVKPREAVPRGDAAGKPTNRHALRTGGSYRDLGGRAKLS